MIIMTLQYIQRDDTFSTNTGICVDTHTQHIRAGHTFTYPKTVLRVIFKENMIYPCRHISYMEVCSSNQIPLHMYRLLKNHLITMEV